MIAIWRYAISFRMDEMQTLRIRLEKSSIAYTKFILEAYDGLGILSVIDPQEARAVLTYPACQAADMLEFVDALIKEGAIKEAV